MRQQVLRDQFLGTGGCVPTQWLHRSGGLVIRHPRQRYDKLALGEPAFLSQGRLGLLRLALGNGQERLAAKETGDGLLRWLDRLQELFGASDLGRIRAVDKDVEKRDFCGLAPQGVAFVLQRRSDLRKPILGRLVGCWIVVEQASRHRTNDFLDLGCRTRG